MAGVMTVDGCGGGGGGDEAVVLGLELVTDQVDAFRAENRHVGVHRDAHFICQLAVTCVPSIPQPFCYAVSANPRMT